LRSLQTKIIFNSKYQYTNIKYLF